MRILLAASEMVPFSKTGGLADVAGALTKALSRLGHEVIAVTPLYKSVKEKGFAIEDIDCPFGVPISNREEYGEIFRATLDNGVTVYFIGKAAYYDREQLYRTQQGDYPDNAERFIFFSKAVLELCKVLKINPDVIHCNDWQTGLVPLYLHTLQSREPVFQNTATVFTIHNIGYQGLFWHLDMHLTNLPWDLFMPDGIEFYGKINLLKAGIIGADILNTVSPRYAREIQTPEFGAGLEGILRKRSDRLFGVLNGVDYDEWNPESDKYLVANYGPADLSGKAQCKRDLAEQFGLPVSDHMPVIGVVSRLDNQKGFDILAPVMDDIVEQGYQFVLLGTGDKEYHALFEKLAKKHAKRVGVKLLFSNELAHKVEAGADIFLMPSRYEPCGLNQMYSLKYGTVPLVRATGGLDDTVVDYAASPANGNGFKFEEYSSTALLAKLAEARKFYENPEEWNRIIQNGMACDFSWDASAGRYEELYQKALSLSANR
ncbi:MAG: glycogen synthase GlgA [Candidatus Abyssobacteria bacterium SURF_17]|uniref:Glycogen synthase n=1 Tax=Candidatus Abyssobacteria bacterium SURF_17 TaxID=2093361 RepID=A0A419F677_9BACT|nr:MAG: glycogen synthase GlgA [Candidatus Abyssubacteria bacterium SURF_17]